MIRPYPKAGERKAGVRRRSGKSRILTDTPEKLALMPDLLRKNSRPNQKCRSEKKSMANKKQRNREGKKATPATNKKSARKSIIGLLEDSSDVEQMELELRRLKKAKNSTELTTADEEVGLDEGALPTLESDDSDQYDDELRNVVADEQELPVKEGDFVLVKLSGKKVQKHYIGQVSQVPSHDQKGTIKYLKREKQSSFQFVFTNDDEYDIEEEDIVQK
jgi:hypothetical protein